MKLLQNIERYHLLFLFTLYLSSLIQIPNLNFRFIYLILMSQEKFVFKNLKYWNQEIKLLLLIQVFFFFFTLFLNSFILISLILKNMVDLDLLFVMIFDSPNFQCLWQRKDVKCFFSQELLILQQDQLIGNFFKLQGFYIPYFWFLIFFTKIFFLTK